MLDISIDSHTQTPKSTQPMDVASLLHAEYPQLVGEDSSKNA